MSASPERNLNSGSLLRLFQSECFDAHLHMHYLLRMEQSGIQDYLVNELYKMADDDIDFYLPQLSQIALLRYSNSSLHRFLLDKAAHSMHFALKIHWLVQSVVEDRTPELWENALAMVNACETAMVNSSGQGRHRGIRATAPPRQNEHHRSNSPKISRSTRRSQSSPPDIAQDVRRGDASEEGPPPRGSSLSSRSKTPPPSLRRSSLPSPIEPGPRLPDTAVARDTAPVSPHVGAASTAAAATAADTVGGAAAVGGDHPRTPSTPSRRGALRHLATLTQSCIGNERALVYGLAPHLPDVYAELGEPVKGWALGATDEDCIEGEMRQFMLKQRRCDYFNTQSHLVSMIMKLSTALTTTQEASERLDYLRSTLQLVNRWLFDRRMFMALNNEGPLSLLGLHIPILRRRDTRQQVVRVHIDQCKIFSSATRAPFLLVYETVNLDEVGGAAPAAASEEEVPSEPAESEVLLPRPVLASLAACVAREVGGQDNGGDPLVAGDGSPRRKLWGLLTRLSPEEWQTIPAWDLDLAPCARCSHTAEWVDTDASAGTREAGTAEAATTTAAATTGSSATVTAKRTATDETAGPCTPAQYSQCPKLRRNAQAVKARAVVWGESWPERVKRVRSITPFGHYRSWTLDAVVVKGADDLRQELLAAQVVRQFSSIFKDARLPLWLRETEVLVTSSSSGLLEYIYDSSSIDSMKKHFPGKTLAEIFKVAFADQLFQAKQNFIESCAAYSLVIWFLQVKDRHNGNLMMDSRGHVIHIDFGFMLSNSPGGNMAFEQSPFKLTQEFLDVMDGECSDQYEYFRTLVIRGFLEARKHMERIILPVRMMLTGSKIPCFREGADWVLQTLHDRFFVNLTEEACIEKIVDLIDASVNNWRTIQYDNYQRIVNGIL